MARKNPKNPTRRADLIETAEGDFAQAISLAGDEYRENLALGMPRPEAEAIWYERRADANARRGEALDHIDIEMPA